jgi:predicted adenine nucleotide alpha hydrolase (AANH) superfamily ATPase
MSSAPARPRLLVHACCAPCACVPLERLVERYDLALVFDGLNIHPAAEAERRLADLRRLCGRCGVELIERDHQPALWERVVGPHAAEPESSHRPRCQACYRLRMERTAALAHERGFDCFTMTLSLSRHKSSSVLAALGREVAAATGVAYLAEDFKKRDGYGLSLQRSRELGLYRQDYCGCRLSLDEARERRARRRIGPSA